MRPIFIDLHIHTSENPNSLNESYDYETLLTKVKSIAKSEDYLISLTDHNTINKKIYLDVIDKIKDKLILGVELHIQSHKGEDTKAYHCHIYFNFDGAVITPEIIDDINSKLDKLYPDKAPSLTDGNIPFVQDIIEAFDEYDFILLPHGGQTHATFDTALPDGRVFDNAMQRSIYYNFFDGFTSRSDQKTEKTIKYLERLGVHEFVNLITCTDNYDPDRYPSPKNEETYKFIPTWMFASPTFGGLRLSLSDSSRLKYSHEKPREWQESIKSIKLQNSKIDIDINLTPGLNVIIGESSSGKTLLADSLFKKIAGISYDTSIYKDFGVSDIEVNYPENLDPHFIEQNYVVSITREDKRINDIEIIGKILPENKEARKEIGRGLKQLDDLLTQLFYSVESIESLEAEIKRIPILSTLITSDDVKENILKKFVTTISSLEYGEYSEFDEQADLEYLNELNIRLERNPFVSHNKDLIEKLKEEIKLMRTYSILENRIRKSIEIKKKYVDDELRLQEGDSQEKKQNFDLLISKMKKYYSHLIKFEEIVKKIAEFSIKASSGKLEIEKCTLSIENKFELNKEILREEFNKVLLKKNEITKYEDITPERLFKDNFKRNLKGSVAGGNPTYKVIQENINSNLIENDQIKYKIIDPDGVDFDTLSPGLKTAVILELILNFEGDRAPLIIDQPEDNLATSYMNEGLVRSIKKMKDKKQIIFVSHNATIPMAGDAQNIIICRNIGNKIVIRSSPLEGKVDKIDVVDYIAKIADGGKSSIKKRFKKYNLKKYKS